MDPAQRFQSVADFKAALGSAAQPARLAAPAPARPISSTPAPARAAPPWGWVAAVAGLSVMVLLLLATVLRGEPPPERSSAQATVAASPTSPLVSEASQMAYTMSPVSTTPQPSPQPLKYVVTAGETCSEIAQAFGISIREIVNLNDLPADCGVILAGQTLLIPESSSGGRETWTAIASPTPVKPVATQVSPVDGMVQVYIPSGQFLMGTLETEPGAGTEEKPQHQVYLSVYWIDQTEVTNAMYLRCVREGVCRPPKESRSNTRPAYFDEPGFANYPVIYVSWEDADAYCRWAGRRLPSEAEWEKAARGGDGRTYPWGEDPPGPAMANYNNQVGDTRAVGSYPAGAGPYGALDMAGNVAEWVADWYDPDYYPVSDASNPTGPELGEFRVLRGGSWFNMARAMRAAFRLSNYPDLQSNTLGFRCAR
jgi:formylglycine-generating enzyme required for sulfatase activity